MQWNAGVHRLDLGLYFHPRVSGNEGSGEGRTCCSTSCRAARPSHYPLSYCGTRVEAVNNSSTNSTASKWGKKKNQQQQQPKQNKKPKQQQKQQQYIAYKRKNKTKTTTTTIYSLHKKPSLLSSTSWKRAKCIPATDMLRHVRMLRA